MSRTKLNSSTDGPDPYRGFLVRVARCGLLEVVHVPCGGLVFGFDEDPEETTGAELLFIFEAHRCPQGT